MPIVGRNVDEAARRLLRGEVVAFATETVYGLGALAADSRALATMYKLKRRPKTHPCIVHLHSFSQAAQWAEIPNAARRLAKAFMPGALSLILPAKAAAANEKKTVALRVPSHPVARALLKKVGAGIAAPSANRFGKLSPTCAADVCAAFANETSLYILDGGQCEVGLESAIVSCLNGRVAIVRPGVLSAKKIAAAAKTKLSPPPDIAAPGNLRAHYAPQKPLFVLPSEILHSQTFAKQLANKNAAALSGKNAKVSRETAAMLSGEAAAALSGKTVAVLSRECPFADVVLWRRAAKSPRQYARNLYATLRELEKTSAQCIIAELPPDTPAWTAPRDRLRKASAKKN